MVSVFFLSCGDRYQPLDHSPYVMEVRPNFPAMQVPDNNPMTVASVALGRQLFFDKRLSGDGTISCADCHKASSGFADDVPKSAGVDGALGFRNSGSLANVAYLPYFNRDGGVRSLDVFSAVPIEDESEMHHNLRTLAHQLQEDDFYEYQAQEIYKRHIDAFVITRALGSYLRTFVSDQSTYDRFLMDNDRSIFTTDQLAGLDLFFGNKAHCGKCHSGVLLSNFEFENNGLYPDYKGLDRGRERVTMDSLDSGKFRVASLRNIALTAPYMHDGSLPSLEAVLDHYSSHGSTHVNEHPLIDQISITEDEKRQIISFLHTFTDTSFINREIYKQLSN